MRFTVPLSHRAPAQWLLPQYQEDWFLARAVVRYRRFLHLQTLYPTLLLEPPLDVALIILAHQVRDADLPKPSHQLSSEGVRKVPPTAHLLAGLFLRHAVNPPPRIHTVTHSIANEGEPSDNPQHYPQHCTL